MTQSWGKDEEFTDDGAHLLAQVHAELGLAYAQTGESSTAVLHMGQALFQWKRLFDECSEDMRAECFPDPPRTRLVLRATYSLPLSSSYPLQH
jgi:hypothetical protein